MLNGTTGTSDMLLSVNYYNDEGLVVKSFSQHYKGGTVAVGNFDEISNTYDFSQAIEICIRSHKVSDVEKVRITCHKPLPRPVTSMMQQEANCVR
ncbi:hypothetical protein [Arcticibacter eurypsychrophilus]|uniref:hypothetical protein n=1 Tax=Arcticibacter eurypsychrophilus TaxID=1434752 RepID=UPI001112D4DC|nr:hypothetical protein [Arcticibacter eurypsychrophilus]